MLTQECFDKSKEVLDKADQAADRRSRTSYVQKLLTSIEGLEEQRNTFLRELRMAEQRYHQMNEDIHRKRKDFMYAVLAELFEVQRRLDELTEKKSNKKSST